MLSGASDGIFHSNHSFYTKGQSVRKENERLYIYLLRAFIYWFKSYCSPNYYFLNYVKICTTRLRFGGRVIFVMAYESLFNK